MATDSITGSEALARGALDAGVQFVTGYPGSPATATLEALVQLRHPEVRAEWATNEKSAFDAAFAASLAGVRSLVCFKSVGLNVALDSLMVSNLAPGNGGFVILVGDDPGGWGSQNEEDARPLVAAAELPLIEPTSANEARSTMRQAFRLAEGFGLPVVLRITRALAVAPVESGPCPRPSPRPQKAQFTRQPERYNVLPINVVSFHKALHASLEQVRTHFEAVSQDAVKGEGAQGVVAAGQMCEKLQEVLLQGGSPPLRVYRLGMLHPLPETHLLGFLRDLRGAVVLEETAPYLETHIQALAQRAGLTLPIYGRHTGHVPGTGELFAPEIVHALSALLPEWTWPAFEETGRPMPSRQALCDDCPYEPTLEALLAVMERHGGRERFVVTGETGCMVRAQLPPWEILDLKYGLGSSIGLAAGLARTGIPQAVVALSGDSALLHSGFAELIDAVQSGTHLLVLVLANKTTALSGGQPHPGTDHDVLGSARDPVDLAAIVRATGTEWVSVVDPVDAQTTEATIEAALMADGVAVVIAERACPQWEGRSAA